MTAEIGQTFNASSRSAVNKPGHRARAPGQTAFELLLNLQLISKMPEVGGSDRLKEHLKAQERRSDERTGRAAAQQQLKGGGRRRVVPSGAERSRGASLGSESSARGGAANVLASASSARGAVGLMGTQNDSASALAPKPAQTALAGTDAASHAAQRAEGTDGTGFQRGKGDALSSLINSHSSGRSVSAQGRSVEAVSSVKAGGSSVTQHGWSGVRTAGHTAGTARGRPGVPTHRAPLFEFDQQKVLAQVGRGLAAALKREGGMVTLRLNPQALGELKITIELNQGRVSAAFRAENESARQLLESSLDALKSSLEARGLRVDRLYVEPPSESGHKQQNGSPNEPNGRGQTPGGDRETMDDGDRPDHSPGMAHNDAGSDPPADAEASVDENAVSDARIAEDSTLLSGLDPGEDEILVRVRLDAVA